MAKIFSPTLGLYSLAWKMTRPVLRKHHRLSLGFAQRMVPQDWPFSGAYAKEDPSSLPCNLWIQAASGGEAFLAWELLKELGSLLKGAQVLCTSCTEQGLDILKKAQDDLDGADFDINLAYFPLDEPKLMRRAVAKAFAYTAPGPRQLVLLETEIWPALLAACKEAGVGVMIVNGRLSPGTSRQYRLIRGLLRRLAPGRVMAVSEKDQERFQNVFGEAKTEYSLMPNIKFDRLALDFAAKSSVPDLLEGLKDPQTQLLVLGSVRREEEKDLLNVIVDLRTNCPRAAIAIAPRHMHRVESWRVLLKRRGLPYNLRSALHPLSPGSITIWDKFGELGALYAMADAAFVGGSLAPLGGQNFLEPVQHGLTPCIGPSWHNFAWAGQEIFDQGLVVQVPNSAALGPALQRMLKNPPDKTDVKKRLQNYIAPHLGGSKTAALAIADMLTVRE